MESAPLCDGTRIIKDQIIIIDYNSYNDLVSYLRRQEVPQRDEVPEHEPQHDVLAVERQERLEEREGHRAQLRLAADA